VFGRDGSPQNHPELVEHLLDLPKVDYLREEIRAEVSGHQGTRLCLC
jgi:hypothetical protein